MPYLDTQTAAPQDSGVDFDRAFTDFDGWRNSLSPEQQQAVDDRFKFTASDKLDQERKRWLSVGYVAQQTGQDVADVTRNFENLYMPGYAKHEQGLALSDADMPRDVNSFAEKVRGKMTLDRERKQMVSGITDERGRTSGGLLEAAEAAAYADDPQGFAKWQAANRDKPGYQPDKEAKYLEAWQAVTGKINEELGPHRTTIRNMVKSLQSQTGADDSNGWAEWARPEYALRELAMSDPKVYDMALRALQVAGAAGQKDEGKGLGQKSGEAFFRTIANSVQGSERTVQTAGAMLADAVGADDAAKLNRADVQVKRDLQDLAQGIIDPAVSQRKGWAGIVENGVIGTAGSVPLMLAAMHPAGFALMAGGMADDARADFRSNGWTGEGAESAAMLTGIVSAGVEEISEVAGKIPGVKQVLAKFGAKPGSRWLSRLVLNAIPRAPSELGEEYLQDTMSARVQELARDIYSAVPARADGHSFAEESKNWWQVENAAPVAIAMFPLALIGAGVTSRQEIGAAKADAFTSDQTRLTALVGEEEAARIAAIPDGEQRAQALRETFDKQGAERRLENIKNAAQNGPAQAMEMRNVADSLLRRQGYTMTRNADGWQLATPDGATVRTKTAGEAIGMLSQHFSETELANARAVADMADTFIDQKAGNERFEISPGQTRNIQDELKAGTENEKDAREAIITAGRLAGLTEEESMQQIGAILGTSKVEENQGVREAVSRIYNGANVLTVVEEAIEGRWKRGLLERRWTMEQGKTWVRMAEQATGESFLPAKDSDVTDRDITEAISYIVRADVLGRARDGSRFAPGLISKGLVAAHRMGKEAGREGGKLKTFIESWRHWIKRVMGTAKALKAARASGALDGDWHGILDSLTGVDGQTRYENEVAKEASDWVDPDSLAYNPKEGETFSLVPKSLAARVQGEIQKKVDSDPEFRSKVYTEMARRVAALRNDRAFHNFGKGPKTIQGVDSVSAESWIAKRALEIAEEKKNKLAPDVLRDSQRQLNDVTDPEEREAVKLARQTVRDLETEARRQAREEAPGSPEHNEQQRKKLVAAIRTADAMAMVLPPEVRAGLGGMAKLATLKTNDAMAKWLSERLEKIDTKLEAWMRKDTTERFVKLLEQSKAKGGGGDKPEGKLGAFGHEWFDDVRDAFAMTSKEAETRINELQGLLQDPKLDPAKGDEYLRELTMAEVFGGWESMDAAEMADALQSARDMFSQSREQWTEHMAKRRAADEAKRAKVVKELGTAGDLASKSAGAGKRKDAPAKGVLDNIARWMMTPADMLKSWLGQKSELAEDYAKREMKAAMKNRDEVNASEDALQKVIGDVTGHKGGSMKNQRQRNQWLHEKSTKEYDVSILIGRETTEDSLEIEDARDIVENEDKAYTAKQRDEMRRQIELADIAKSLGLKKDRKKRVTFETVKSDGERKPAKFTEAEISWILALHDQAKLRPALEASGFDAEAIESMRKLESPEMRHVRQWMVQQLKDEHGAISRIYADLRGVNLPQIENYFPAKFVHDGNTDTPLPGSQGAAASGMMGTGALRNRKTHKAQLAYDADGHTVNLFSLFWKHKAEMSYWKAYAQLAREIKSVFNRGSVQQAFEAKFGKGQVRELSNWVQSIENGGMDAGHLNEEVSHYLNRVLSGNAANALGLKLGTNLVNLSSALNTLLDTSIPFSEVMKSYGRVMSGKSIVKPSEVWDMPAIQRRLKGGVSPMAQVIKQAAQAAKPGLAADINMVGFHTIGLADSLGGSVAAAASYDAHYRQAKKAGLSDVQAREAAEQGMEQTIYRTFQPAEQGARALYELNPNIAWKMFTLFSSEARQKIGIELAAIQGAMKGELPKADALRVIAINHLVMGSLVWALKSLARDLQKGDDGDDDPSWEWRDWVASVTMGPLSGVPFFGAGATWALSTLIGAKAYSNSENPIVEGLSDLYGGGKGLVRQLKGESSHSKQSEFMQAMNNTNRILHGFSTIIGGPYASAASIVGNGVMQAAGIVDNAVKE